MSNFKVGQRVRCVGPVSGAQGTPTLEEGKIYTVTKVTTTRQHQIMLNLDGYNDQCQQWFASRFESVEEDRAMNALREEIKDLEHHGKIQAKTFDEIREHLSVAGLGTTGHVADCVKEALDYLVGRRDYWKEQAKIARARGDHKSGRVSDLIRERDSLKEEITGLRERLGDWRGSKQFQDMQKTIDEKYNEIAELESIILNQGLNKKADLIRERDSLRDKVETKDAIIAKQESMIMRHQSEIAELRQAVDVEDSRTDALAEERIYWKDQTEIARAMLAKQNEAIKCLKAKHFDAIDEARRLREALDCLKASTVSKATYKNQIEHKNRRISQLKAEQAELLEIVGSLQAPAEGMAEIARKVNDLLK